jgi:hypothetical protein
MSAPNLLLRFLKKAILLWIGTIFFLAGIGAAIAGAHDWRKARHFAREAVTAPATVVSKSIEGATRDGNTSTRYLVAYRFAAGAGTNFEQTEEFPVEDWEQLEQGSALDVRYLTADPSSARVRAGTPAWVPPLIVGLTTLFALLGATMAVPQLRRALVVWRLQRSGIAAQGVVVDVSPTRVRVKRVTQWRLRYEFRDAEGRTQEGASDYLAPHEAAEWQAGDRGALRYDRERPRDSVWIGKREWE